MMVRLMPTSISENNIMRMQIAFAGLCLSLITLFSEELVNRDGVLYFKTAQAFDEYGFAASFKQYRWPFYSIAIAFCHTITTLSFEKSAHLLNLIFLLVLVDAFVRFYWEVNLKLRYRWMPALVILAFTGLNDYRPLIIRDWGYWAFLFQALFYFLKAYKTERFKFHILWQIFIILAFLFRIEAIVFMVLMPLWLLFKKRSISTFFQMTSLFFLPVVFLFFDSNWQDWGRIRNITHYMDIVSLSNRFVDYSYIVAKQAIPHYAGRFDMLFVLSGLIGVLLYNIMSKLGIIYLCAVVIGQFRYKVSKDFQSSIVNLLLAAAFFTIFVYFCNSRVLAGRYLIQLSLFLLLYVSYFAECILDEVRNSEKTWMMSLFGGVFLINLVAGIYHSDSNKLHIKEMGKWVSKNIPDSSYITTNDSRLYYYSGGIFKKNMTDRFSLRKNEYALLRVKHDNTEFDELIKAGKLVKIHSVKGRKGDLAILFKINNP